MKIKFLFVSIVLFTLFACAGPGPMQIMAYGPINTPVFEPIILNTVNDGSKRVLFKERSMMYENKEFVSFLGGVFFITDNGAYMAFWDNRGYEYKLEYRINAIDIASIHFDKINRKMWVDTDLLIITDNDGHEVGFSLIGKNAASSFLKKIAGK